MFNARIIACIIWPSNSHACMFCDFDEWCVNLFFNTMSTLPIQRHYAAFDVKWEFWWVGDARVAEFDRWWVQVDDWVAAFANEVVVRFCVWFKIGDLVLALGFCDCLHFLELSQIAVNRSPADCWDFAFGATENFVGREVSAVTLNDWEDGAALAAESGFSCHF